MLAMERPGTFGAAGTSAGSPPSNFSNNVALSFTLIVLLSNDAVNVEASTVEVNWLTANRVRSAKHHEAFHEPQGAAGILPAEESEKLCRRDVGSTLFAPLPDSFEVPGPNARSLNRGGSP